MLDRRTTRAFCYLPASPRCLAHGPQLHRVDARLLLIMGLRASKAAVINLANTSAQILAGTDIRVVRQRSPTRASPLPWARSHRLFVEQNAICPGLIETGMTTFTFDRARERGTLGKVGQLNPLRRCASIRLSFCSQRVFPKAHDLWLTCCTGLGSRKRLRRQRSGSLLVRRAARLLDVSPIHVTVEVKTGRSVR